MPELNVKIEGMVELRDALEKLERSLNDPDMIEAILKEQAIVVADDARRRAPQGPTGHLKRGIIAKILKRRGDVPAPAIAGVDYRIAPHAKLVEFGTSERHQKKSGRYTGKMPRHPFLRPAWDYNKRRVLNDVINKLRALVEKSAK